MHVGADLCCPPGLSARRWVRRTAAEGRHGRDHPRLSMWLAWLSARREWLWISSEDERHEHFGRMLVDRVGVGELLGEIALLDGRAIDEVDPR